MILEERAEKYVRGLTNDAKRMYARRYMEYLLGDLRDAPLYETFALTVMGAQAVRMNLIGILGER